MATTAGTPPSRRLLVISYHHPANGEVGGLRWAGLTRNLAAHGWETWFLTAAPLGASHSGPGVTVESCAPGPTISELYRRARRAAPAVPLPPHRVDVTGDGWIRRVLLRPLGTLRSEMSGLLYLLSEGQGWTLRAARRARALIAQVQPDVVVSSGPPHLPHLAAWLATRGKNVRWIVDLRDPWAGPVARAWQEQYERGSRIADALARAAERLAIGTASAVFTTTRELAEALTGRYPRATITWVPNGADAEALPPRSPQPFRGLAIAHVGTLYGGRDARPVLRALRLFLDRHPEARRDGTMFRHAGPEEAAHAQVTRHAIDELDLGEFVSLQRPLPRAAALDLLSRSGLAVVLAQDQDYQVPSKLYESIAMGVPTLVIAGPDTATAREGARVGAFVADPEDVDAIADLYQRLWSGTPGIDQAAEDGRARCDYRALAPTVAALLRGVA